MPVTRSLPKLAPAIAFKLLFKLKSLADLLVFELHDLIVAISHSMDICKNFQGFLFFLFGYQPSRAFGHEPNEAYLKHRWEGLDD